MGQWTRATYHGVSVAGDPNVDDSNRAFYGGRIDDVLPLGGTLLLASPRSGVWNTSDTSAAPAFNFTEWFPSPNLTSLALGTQSGNHVFAGGDALYETDTTHAFPLANWKQIPLLPATTMGQILDILVLKNSRRIVLACGRGLFWSGIPDTGGSYGWVQAQDPNNPGTTWADVGFSCVTEGPNESVIAGIWGGGDALKSGFYYGHFHRHINGPHRVTRLDLVRSGVSGLNPPDWTKMGRTSVASFAADNRNVFALAGDFNTGNVYRTIRSTDGGVTWFNTGNFVVNNNLNNGVLWENGPITGGQGSYVNCIAVGPTAADSNRLTVAIGWSSGYFLSIDSGNNWNQVVARSGSHLHPDVHSLVFDPEDTTSRTLYIASDGGLARTTDLGTTHTSRQNVGLYNQLISKLTVSYQNPGLVAASCQDLGDIYCNVDSQITQAWRAIMDDNGNGDGTGVVFTRNGRLLNILNTITDQNNVEFGNVVRDAIYDSNSETFSSQHYFPTEPLSRGVIPLDNSLNGLPLWAFGLDGPVGPFSVPVCPMAIVNSPRYKNAAGETMIAIAARSPRIAHSPPRLRVELLGLFTNLDNGNWRSNPTHWTQLATAPAQAGEHCMSIGSADGTEVWVGTGKGRILRFDTTNNFHMDDLSPPDNAEPIWGFVLDGDLNSYAISTGASLFKTKLVLEDPRPPIRTKLGWDKIPGPSSDEVYAAIITDWTTVPKALYLATQSHVYESRDNATTWRDISGTANGLPTVPNITSLQFLVHGSGAQQRKRLFLGTYGWGLYTLDL